MEIDLADVTPLLTWMLGPNWAEGRLFHPLAFTLFILLVCGGLVWAIARSRKGTGSVGRGAALTIGGVSAAVIVIVALAVLVWKLLSLGKTQQIAWTVPLAESAEKFANNWLEILQWLLGPDWRQGALYQWCMVVFFAAAAVFAISWLIATIRRGPGAALQTAGRAIGECVLDVVRISPRRVAALAWLGIKESIRRRVIVVFLLFVVILLFAGWFLDPESVDPARLYLSFVLSITKYLVILLVLFLSALSLPADIKSHTLYTIVTKPVRSSEVVLGRIAGFAAVASCLLLIMAAISYFFVLAGLAHTHQIKAEDVEVVGFADGKPTELRGHTTLDHHHRHKLVVYPSGEGRVEMEQGHWHNLKGDWSDLLAEQPPETAFQLGQPKGMLEARVPIYGKIRFLDSKGKPTEKGINVGDEWTYRSYIGGGAEAAAIWTFDGVDEERFPAGLPVELNLGVFRTHKGDIEQGVLGSLWVRNPLAPEDEKPKLVRVFESKEFQTDSQFIPREFLAGDKTVDLFKDIVSDGKIEIWLRCDSRAQFLGVAQADMYLRATDAWFWWNFVKGYIGIWLLALLVIGMGVLFSTFLSAPIAALATAGALLGGLFHDFMTRLAMHETYGGGPTESFLRIVTQDNVVSELKPGLQTTVVQTLDQPLEIGLRIIAALLPDVSRFGAFSNLVASGFNIPGDTIMTYACRTFAYLLPMFVAGYLCLKNREVAQQ
ncbi:MAG: hypothetical protein JW959_01685 [Pirellulales bacterium]|nr:hypothetical protein [Pirellulales bacterium]